MAIRLDDYEPVEERISRFKSDHPNYRVITDLVASEGEAGKTRWIVKASVWRDAENTGMPDATGYAFEIDGQGMAQKTAALETCETSAIGRALANIGYAGNRRVTREEMRKPYLEDVNKRIGAAQSEDELKAIWDEVNDKGMGAHVSRAITTRKNELAGGA